MTQLHAQPYDMSANGFYFDDCEQYQKRASALRNTYGDPVEEFEIQFIDGDNIDCELAEAWGIHQANIKEYFDAVDAWETGEKIKYIIAVGEGGYTHAQLTDAPNDIDIEIHELDTLKELAEQFAEEGLFGDISERLQFYLDYDAIARDLGVDYSETTINGTNLIYRLG